MIVQTLLGIPPGCDLEIGDQGDKSTLIKQTATMHQLVHRASVLTRRQYRRC
jgi:hypothetical protein